MSGLVENLLPIGSFIPHGYSYLWQPQLVWLHILSDSIIALAYYSIPITLIYFVQKRKDLPFDWIFLLFSAFIVSCGTTHIMDVWTLWYPTYWLAGALKALTAVVSLYTAISLVQLMPQALTIPSPAQLSAVNFELTQQIRDRREAEAQVRQLNEDLEIKVAQRTAELEKSVLQSQNHAERLTLAMDVANMGSWDWDLETNQLTWSASHEILWGYQPGNSNRSYEDWARKVHPDDLAKVEAAIEYAKAARSDLSKEYRVIQDNGTERWVTGYGRCYFRNDGEPYRMMGIVQDITDRKQAEELVRRTAAIDVFRISLADALRRLADPIEIQSTASRLLGERVSANRVVYFEVRGADYVVERDYVINAEPLVGSYPITSFGPTLLAAYLSGQVVSCSEVATDPRQSPDQRSAYAAIQIGAYIGVPLIKNGEFVAGLAVHAHQSRNWTQEEIALAEETAERTWAAVERVRAEVALHVSESRYRTLFELFDGGFCICEMLFDESGNPVDYRFLEVNSLFNQLTGLEQPVGKTARELVSNLETHWFEIYGRVVQTGESVRFEDQSIAMNRWFEVNAFCVGEPQSNQFAIVFTNISDRKSAEQERERFLAVGSDLQVITGINGYCQWASPTFEQTLGWTVEEITSYPWMWVIHPDDISKSLLETERLFSGQETVVFENRFRHKDGSYHWLLWKAQPYLEEQVIYAAAVDITERKRAEESLQLSEERLRLATEAASIGMWFWDLTEDRLVWTTICKRLFGIDPDAEVSYERFLEALHPDDRDRTRASVQQAIEHKQDYAIEYRSLWSDGSTHWILANGRAFYNEQGEPIRMMGIAKEITERKLAEATLQAQARKLSQMNIQLVQITTLVNQRNQELDQFTHIVSHDLKAPLRAISNLSEWIEEDLANQVPPETKQNLDLLRSRVARMEALINGLLEYARIGYHDTSDEPIALNEMLIEIVDLLAIPPEFLIHIPPNLPTVSANRLLLSQVFTNLISNAVKHHDRPNGQIEITAQVQTQDYKFTVSDDGPGIASENQSRVFDIFRTLGSQNRKDSTGIGLAIIKKIIERIGGKIYIESESGQGTSFIFTWPISQSEAKR